MEGWKSKGMRWMEGLANERERKGGGCVGLRKDEPHTHRHMHTCTHTYTHAYLRTHSHTYAQPLLASIADSAIIISPADAAGMRKH